MKKLLCASLLASLLVPASAMAIEEGAEFEVYVNDDFAGTLIPYLFKEAGKSCLYTSEWYNQLYIASQQCDFIEKKAKGHLSCRDNKCINFPTVIASDVYCQGWNDSGYSVDVDYLNVGEHYDGFSGVVKFAGWYGFSSIEAWEV